MDPTVQVWTVDLDGGPPDPDCRGGDAARRRVARAIAIERVAGLAGVTLARRCPVCGRNDHGRPELSGDRDINMTSAGRWGLIALADCRVGVDLELFGSPVQSSTAILSVPEVAALAARSADERAVAFVRLWTAKEAVAKADGRGLTLPFDRLDAAEVLRTGRARIVIADNVWHVTVADHTFPDGRQGSIAIATTRARAGPLWIGPRIDASGPGLTHAVDIPRW